MLSIAALPDNLWPAHKHSVFNTQSRFSPDICSSYVVGQVLFGPIAIRSLECLSLNACFLSPDANLMITDNNGNTALHIAIQVAQKSKSRPGQRCGEDAWRTQPDKDDQKEYLKIVELILSSGDNGCFNELRTPEDHQPGQSNESRQCEQKSNQQTDRTNREFSQQQLVDRQTSPVAGEQAPTPPDSSVGQHGGPFAEQRNNYLTPNEPSEAQSNLVNKQNLFGKTSLHYACLLKPDRFSIKLIKRLLQSKANADIADFRNCTPLFYLLAEHQTEHRSRNESARKCSKACPLRSPFIDLLTNDLHIGYKCDRLNLDELDYGLATLKQLCRQAIQMHSPRLQRRQSIHYKALPDSLRLFLSRKVLPL